MRMGAFDKIAVMAKRLTDTSSPAYLRSAVVAGCACFWVIALMVILV